MHRPNARCRTCGRDVLEAITAAGRTQTLDPGPDPAGNVAVYRDGAGTLRARVPTGDYPLMPWEHLYMPHPATCKGPPPTIGRPAPPPAASVRSLADHRRDRTER